MFSDESLNFSYYIKEKTSKAMKGIKKLRKKLPCPSLITIYRSFRGPHLHYGDTIYDQPSNGSLNLKNERAQNNAALAITGAIKGISE